MAEAGTRDIVLVVDDSPETLGFLTDALEDTGAMVLVATGGEEAIGIVQRISPDVILMDAVMPGIDGFETCRRLKRLPETTHTPILFMTGLTETEHIVEGLAAGGVDYIVKPIVVDELIARIRVHLANARRERSAHIALDTAGRFLLATTAAGDILWSTPQATRLIADVAGPAGADLSLPGPARELLSRGLASGASGAVLIAENGTRRVSLSPLGRTGDDEYLFRLMSDDVGGEEAILKRRFGLTAREAEVLLWIARGKSNRDIGDILGLSPRTVNKHLETVYAKLGVENRASAAVMALKAINEG